MFLYINGEKTEINVETLAEVVSHFKLDEQLVVTEVNGQIIASEERSLTILAEGMKIEIVQFVGGG